MDVTSAMNMLLYADKEGKQVGAEWVIFRRKDAPTLREYLNHTRSDHEGDPILSQNYFLNDGDLERRSASVSIHTASRGGRFHQRWLCASGKIDLLGVNCL